MSESEESERLARLWLECWSRGAPEEIPLAEDFVHISPFGRLEGRRHYIETVKPLSKKNVNDIKVLRVIAQPGLAAIHYELETPHGAVPACDWIECADGRITRIEAFYDRAAMQGPGDD